MSNSLSSLKLFIQTIVGAKPWNQDPSVARKPWSEAEYDLSEHGGMDGKLCFSIMWDNGIVKPHPPLQRAMRMTKDALEAAGHTGDTNAIIVKSDTDKVSYTQSSIGCHIGTKKFIKTLKQF